MHDDALEVQLVELLAATVKGLLFKFFSLFLVLLQSLQILHSQRLPQFEALLCERLKVELLWEEEPRVDLGIDEEIIVENDTFEVDEENIGHLFQNVSLGRVGTGPAGLAEAVRDELPRMHAVQCGLKVIFSLDFHTIAEKCLKPLSFGPAGMTNHLRHLRPLEQLLE